MSQQLTWGSSIGAWDGSDGHDRFSEGGSGVVLKMFLSFCFIVSSVYPSMELL